MCRPVLTLGSDFHRLLFNRVQGGLSWSTGDTLDWVLYTGGYGWLSETPTTSHGNH